VAVLCFNISLAYFPVPKIACTTIKLALFEIDHGYPITDRVGPDPANNYIHWHLRTDAFRPDVGSTFPKHFEKMVVVRDPIERFVSAYRNRIVHLREAAQAGTSLPRQPDIETFTRLLPAYMQAAPMIAHHFAPQIGFIGYDLGWYDRVFRFDQWPDVAAYLSDKVGRPVNLGVTQNEGPRLSASNLRPETLALLRQYYADDYKLFAKFGVIFRDGRPEGRG
jgi:hypothetical protein